MRIRSDGRRTRCESVLVEDGTVARGANAECVPTNVGTRRRAVRTLAYGVLESGTRGRHGNDRRVQTRHRGADAWPLRPVQSIHRFFGREAEGARQERGGDIEYEQAAEQDKRKPHHVRFSLSSPCAVTRIR